MNEKIILNPSQINRKLNRIAYQIIEDNFNQAEIILAGLQTKGKIIAERIKNKIADISKIKVNTIPIDLNADSKAYTQSDFKHKSVIIVDDILNTGNSMLNAINKIFVLKPRQIRTVVLINRSHNLFPVKVDFFGLELSTIKEEYIYVKLKEIDNIDQAILK